MADQWQTKCRRNDDRVLFTFTDPLDVDRVWKGGPWGYNRAPVTVAPYDGITLVEDVPLKKSSYRMTLQGVPPAFRSEYIMRLIGSTLGEFKEYDRPAFLTRVLRIRVEIDYEKPLLFRRRFLVEDEVQILVQFRYDKLFGRCGTCGLVTLVGLPCSGPELVEDSDAPVGVVAQPTALTVLQGHAAPNPNADRIVINNQTLIFKAQIPRSIPKTLLLASVVAMRRNRRQVQIRELNQPRLDENPITGQRRARETDEGPSSNKEQTKRKRGRPIGSVNKLPYGTAGKGKNAKKDEDQKRARRPT
ncbi:uncharacterized protein LOC112185178 [Rosa chinensis]|uniref:uncharacterized protein LOC112185178 n=1 Tax=Rosa chinensis TaxID=74649 RepID=UPI000D0865FF|nr:uncharacterized protein LOC112185178 [Rosa chinensis]